jgi:hypothetical protein
MKSPDELRAIAQARDAVHAGMPHDNPALSPEGQYMGVVGEATFEDRYGYPMDTEARVEGDGGWDFKTPAGLVDVKTALKPFYLLLPVHDVGKCDILVLGRYDASDESVEFVGWEYQGIMAKQPTRDFGGGFKSHFMFRGDLRAMEALDWLIEEVRGVQEQEG